MSERDTRGPAGALTCQTCQWFMPKDEASPMSFCRRFPPYPVHTGVDSSGTIAVHFSFAVVSGNNACGEYSARKEQP